VLALRAHCCAGEEGARRDDKTGVELGARVDALLRAAVAQRRRAGRPGHKVPLLPGVPSSAGDEVELVAHAPGARSGSATSAWGATRRRALRVGDGVARAAEGRVCRGKTATQHACSGGGRDYASASLSVRLS